MKEIIFGFLTLFGLIFVIIEISTKGFKNAIHKFAFSVVSTLTVVCAIIFLIIAWPDITAFFRGLGSGTTTGIDTTKPPIKDSIKPPQIDTPKVKCEYQEIEKDMYTFSYQNVSYGCIYIPSSIKEFTLYEQNGASENAKDSREFIDDKNREVGFLSLDSLLCNLGKYISIANSRNKRLIISANDPDRNDWRGNLKMKYGKDKNSLVPFKRSRPYIHSDEKVYTIQGWINY